MKNIITFPVDLHSVLGGIVAGVKGIYNEPNYPFVESERIGAMNIQSVLHNLGYELTVQDSAAFWESYSMQLNTGWVTGAETVDGALEGIINMCQRSKSQNKAPSKVIAGKKLKLIAGYSLESDLVAGVLTVRDETGYVVDRSQIKNYEQSDLLLVSLVKLRAAYRADNKHTTSPVDWLL